MIIYLYIAYIGNFPLNISLYLSMGLLLHTFILLLPVIFQYILTIMGHTNINAISLRVVSWNMRGLQGSHPYVNQLLSHNDICILSEHHLYECELHKLSNINSNFDVYAKSATSLNNDNIHHHKGHGGVAILWRKSLSHNVRKCTELGNDRICVVKVSTNNSVPIYIIGVYLPQRDSIISDFDEYLYHLEYIIEKCQSEGYVAIMGDFNCHFGSGNGPRAWGVTTRNAAKLIKVINRKSLYAADLESLSSGPTYTFHVSGVGTSYIDHCVISKRLSCNIVKCAVIDDDIMNTSDHLPISVDIKANLPNSSNISNDNMAPRVAWGKFSPAEIHDLYTAPVERELHNIYTDYMLSQKSHETPIDDLLQRTIECIINTANRNLPKVQFSKTIKPYWSDVLTNLNETQKVAWRRWVTQGRPRDMNNTSWLQYKEAKRCFRAALRDAEKRYDRKCIDELCNSQTVDHKYFWRLINKHKKIKVFTHATLDEDSGTILYEPQKNTI